MCRLGNFIILDHQGYDEDKVLDDNKANLVELWLYNHHKKSLTPLNIILYCKIAIWCPLWL